jgi:hypothetical protein
MKSGGAPIVPLSSQALAALGELRALSGESGHHFPNEQNAEKCMSENTIFMRSTEWGIEAVQRGMASAPRLPRS